MPGPLDSKREWYRYHHLFADSLRRELSKEEELLIHRKAALWLESNDFKQEAVKHAFSSTPLLAHASRISFYLIIISLALYLDDSLYRSKNTIKLKKSKLTGIIIMKEATYWSKQAYVYKIKMKDLK